MIAPPTDIGSASLVGAPVLTVEASPTEILRLSLPELLTRLLLGRDRHLVFRGLAAEQSAHWYRFLVRCATRALRGSRLDPQNPDVDAGSLERLLHDGLVAAAGSEEAWRLHNPDIHAPAFLQPPVPAGEETGQLADAKYKEREVAMLTALLGSKNFERKSDSVRSLSAAELVYALLEFQSGVIFGGRGNYETQLTPSRSGKGSGVPFMGVRLPEGFSATFRRDVAMFSEAEERIRSDLEIDGEVWALWTEPWAGDEPMPSTELDPAFIPLARLVRLGPPGDDGRFRELWFRTSSKSRVTDVSDGALYGDPFTPTTPNPKSAGSRKVRGVMEGGFTYPEVAELLGFGDREMRPSDSVISFFEQRGSDEQAGVEVLFEGVAFEQGKTLGFYRRVLPLPARRKVGSLLFSEPEPFRNAHTRMLAKVRQAKSILRASARIVLAGEPKPRKGDDALAAIPADRLDIFADEDDAYLRALFRFGEREQEGDSSWDGEWAEWVAGRARDAFHDTLPLLVAPSSQRIRREADAVNHLEGRLWKLRDRPTADETNEPSEEAAQ